MKLKDAKQDSRPFCRGWAPGAYTGTRLTCNEAFIGDKRATQCADCAYKRAEGGQAMIDTKELREIAKAATQGRWLHDPDIATGSDGSPYCQGHNITCANGDIVGVDGILRYRENDAIHIAAFDPPTVLAMLDEIDRLRAENTILRSEIGCYEEEADDARREDGVAHLEGQIMASREETVRLRALLRRAGEALAPFHLLAPGESRDWIGEIGWSDYVLKNERICDGFGPTNFQNARTVAAEIEEALK